MGWTGKTNGELLKLAKGQFDVFLTVDQNLQYQQNLESAKMTVVLLAVKNNRYETLKLLVPKIQKALETAQKGQLVRIET